MMDRPTDTQLRILDAAERLFAGSGFEGTSLRAVMREAGVNVAAIHYHFGSREGLLRAVLDRTVVPLNEERIALLDQALAAVEGRTLRVEEVLDAFMRPNLRTVRTLRRRNPGIAAFLGRMYSQPTPIMRAMMDDQFRAVASRFYPELQRALPRLSNDELAWRMRTCVVGVVIGLFSQSIEGLVDDLEDEEWVEQTLARLVSFASAGLKAPPLEPSLAEGAQRLPPPRVGAPTGTDAP